MTKSHDQLLCMAKKNEKFIKARENHREWQEKLYLENRMMATNDRNDAIRKQVTAIDVNDIQQQKKEAGESAQLT